MHLHWGYMYWFMTFPELIAMLLFFFLFQETLTEARKPSDIVNVSIKVQLFPG